MRAARSALDEQRDPHHPPVGKISLTARLPPPADFKDWDNQRKTLDTLEGALKDGEHNPASVEQLSGGRYAARDRRAGADGHTPQRLYVRWRRIVSNVATANSGVPK